MRAPSDDKPVGQKTTATGGTVTAGRKNGGALFSFPIVPPLDKDDKGSRRGPETMRVVLARIKRQVTPESYPAMVDEGIKLGGVLRGEDDN